MRSLIRLWLLIFFAFGLAAACSASSDENGGGKGGSSNADGGDAKANADGKAGTSGSAGDGGINLDGGTCKPVTCADLGADCGVQADGCGEQLDCGTCVAPEFCGGG